MHNKFKIIYLTYVKEKKPKFNDKLKVFTVYKL